MNPASALAATLGFRPEFKLGEKLATGLPMLDGLIQGFPRGAISEIAGPESSGRATLVHSLLTASTANLEVCAYVDTCDAFDPCSAAASGVVLEQLLWIRCAHQVEHAFRVADYLLHAGGFGVVILDLCRVPDRLCRRIPISYWYRFRRAVENTPAVLAVVEREPLAKSCASLILELTRKKAVWSGAPGFHLLREVEVEAVSRKPVRSGAANFQAAAIA
jgi:recombination protein RecA